MKPDYTVPLLLIFVALMWVETAVRDLKGERDEASAVVSQVEVIGPVFKSEGEIQAEEALAVVWPVVIAVVGVGCLILGAGAISRALDV